jgi:hypothetical protein
MGSRCMGLTIRRAFVSDVEAGKHLPAEATGVVPTERRGRVEVVSRTPHCRRSLTLSSRVDHCTKDDPEIAIAR